MSLGFFDRSAWAQWTEEKGVLLRGKIVTMDEKDAVKNGSLLIRNGKIEAILGPDAPAPEGTIVIDTKGYIYPGLMNLHNHNAYDFIPPYNVEKDYNNRDEWPSGKCYQRHVNNPKVIVTDPNHYGKQTEVLKYANVKEVVGGTTAVQGSPVDKGASGVVIRNVEAGNFEGDNVGSYVMGISPKLKESVTPAKLKAMTAWFFHLAEGKDEPSRLEYSNPDYNPRKKINVENMPGLKELGLVQKSLVAIHATGLTEKEFKDWAKTTGEGPKIVWSPLSNVLLYGETTDILAAMKHGATIALGTDWTPTGSKNLLWEMKVVDQYNKQKLNGALTEKEIVSMVTRNPAKIMNWQDKVGMIKPGMVADVVVFDEVNAANAYRNLIDATEPNVKLVMVGGNPVYGDSKVMKSLKGDKGARGLESLDELDGRPKLLDLKRPEIRDGNQSLKQVVNAIEVASRMNPKTLAKELNTPDPNFPKTPYKARTSLKEALVALLKKAGEPVPPSLKNESSPITEGQVQRYLDLKFPNREGLKEIDSIFQTNDDRFFESFRHNLHLAGDGQVLDLNPLTRFREGAPKGDAMALRGARGKGISDLLTERVAGARDEAKDKVR